MMPETYHAGRYLGVSWSSNPVHSLGSPVAAAVVMSGQRGAVASATLPRTGKLRMMTHVASHAHPMLVHPQASRRTGPRAMRLASAPGVLVVPDSRGGKSVTQNEMQQAVAALRALPAADLALIARKGIAIHLVPVSGLEDGLLGATTIIQDDPTSPWVPTKIRIAVRAGLTGSESIGEIVQHEFGHAVSVLRHQDRSEEAAIRYAREH